MSATMTAEAPSAGRHGLALSTAASAAGSEDSEKLGHGPNWRGFIGRERWDTCLDIRMHVAVYLPMPHLSLQSLCELRAGAVLEAGWQATQDVPVMVEDRFLANGELEPVGERLGIRINGFTEQVRELPLGLKSAAGGGSSDQLVCSLEDLQLAPLLRFGETTMPMREVLGLCVGDTVVLDRGVVAPVTLAAGGRVVASGELVLVSGGYGIRVSEVSQLTRHLPRYDSAF